MNSFSLLVAVLVSLQYAFAASVQDRIALDNNLQSNVLSAPKRHLGVKLSIMEAPPPTIKLEPGKRLVLMCKVLGKPIPSVQWMRNGVLATDYEEDSNDILPADPSSLGNLISKLVVTSAVSGDIFSCVATSGGRQESASTTVFVTNGDDVENLVTIQKLFHLPSKPIITTYLDNVFQSQGTDIVLPCRVFSFVNTETFWQDGDDNIIYTNSRMQVLPSGDLLVRNLKWTDMGLFSCTARDIYGRNTTETTFVYPFRVK